jgi:hypothetical protein
MSIWPNNKIAILLENSLAPIFGAEISTKYLSTIKTLHITMTQHYNCALHPLQKKSFTSWKKLQQQPESPIATEPLEQYMNQATQGHSWHGF